MEVRAETVENEGQNEEIDAERVEVDLDDVVAFEAELILETVAVLPVWMAVD